MTDAPSRPSAKLTADEFQLVLDEVASGAMDSAMYVVAEFLAAIENDDVDVSEFEVHGIDMSSRITATLGSVLSWYAEEFGDPIATVEGENEVSRLIAAVEAS